MNNIIFNNEKDCFNDWNIVLTKIELPLPTPKTLFIDITGSNGVLDLTEALTGDVTYNNRPIKLYFELMNLNNYETLKSEISNYLHGKNITFIQTNDENYYYEGRATISEYQCSKNTGTIVIDIDAKPYKYESYNTSMSLSLNNETKTLKLLNDRMKVCPYITVNGTITMNCNDLSVELESGTQQVSNLILSQGYTNIEFTGTGTVNVSYRKGSL